MKDFVKDFAEMMLSVCMDLSGVSPTLLCVDASVVQAINPFWNALCIFAVGLSIVYFLIEMNKKYLFEAKDMNIKSMFLPFLKLGLSIGVLSMGADLVSSILGFHNAFITKIDNDMVYSMTASPMTGGEISTVAGKLVDSMGFWTQIFACLLFMFGWIIGAIVQLVWNYKALTYQLELLLKVGVTPVALADVYSNSQGAIKWIKSLLAFVLYGASFMVVPKIGMIVASGQFTSAINGFSSDPNIFNVFSGIIAIIIIPIAELGVMGSVKQLCKEVLA